MKIFNKYLIKRSLVISSFIFIIFALLDMVFNIISELEGLTDNYTFFLILKYSITSMPHRSIEFLEGASLLGFMIALGISHQEGNLNVLRSNGKSPIKIILISSIGSMVLVLSVLILDEVIFKELHMNSKIEKVLHADQSKKTEANFQWIMQDNSFLSYTNIVKDTIFNPRLIRIDLDSMKVKYFKSAQSAKIKDGTIVFDENVLIESASSQDTISNLEKFSFPLVASIPFSDIDNLTITQIISYRSYLMHWHSNLEDDILFKAHLDKAYYKKLFYPFSVWAILIFFGAFIFGSLRDSSPGSRIVLAVVGGFLYRISQDLSVSIFISYNLPILIAVVMPACTLILISIYSYKKI